MCFTTNNSDYDCSYLRKLKNYFDFLFKVNFSNNIYVDMNLAKSEEMKESRSGWHHQQRLHGNRSIKTTASSTAFVPCNLGGTTHGMARRTNVGSAPQAPGTSATTKFKGASMRGTQS